jgi:hypothetical protein
MKKLFLFVTVFLFSQFGNSQTCGTCSINIVGLDSSAYTISSGQTICIDTTGNFVGTITLEGGTVCNKGLFNAKILTFNSGTIDNYGNMSFSAVTLSANRYINNKADAISNISGTLIISGGNFTNNGIANVTQNITNNSGTLNNTGILNCIQITGSNTITNSGVINSN